MGSKSMVAAPLWADKVRNGFWIVFSNRKDYSYNSNSASAGFCCPYACLSSRVNASFGLLRNAHKRNARHPFRDYYSEISYIL
jgi:hypothetical protein